MHATGGKSAWCGQSALSRRQRPEEEAGRGRVEHRLHWTSDIEDVAFQREYAWRREASVAARIRVTPCSGKYPYIQPGDTLHGM